MGQLLPEVLGEGLLQPDCCLIVEFAVMLDDVVRRCKLLLRQGLHPDEEPATIPFATRPLLDVLVDLPPATKVEVTDAEIRAMGDIERRLKRWQELLVDVVKNSGHGGLASTTKVLKTTFLDCIETIRSVCPCPAVRISGQVSPKKDRGASEWLDIKRRSLQSLKELCKLFRMKT
jgi:hypothetical protein